MMELWKAFAIVKMSCMCVKEKGEQEDREEATIIYDSKK